MTKKNKVLGENENLRSRENIGLKRENRSFTEKT